MPAIEEHLRLPCGHTVKKPDRTFFQVRCHCGREWQLQRKHGEWTAKEMSDGHIL